MSRRILILLLVAIGVLTTLAILNIPLVSWALSNLLPDTKATKEPFDPYINEIKAYQDELQETGLSSGTRNLIQEKLDSISIMATQRAEGKALQPTRRNSMPATPTFEVASEKLPDGIDNHPSIPFSESVVAILNSWRKTTGDRYYLVYAGFLTQDSEQGVMLILHPSTHIFKQYVTPGKSGGVRIVDEKGTIIVLQSINGILYYFDVAIEQYVNFIGSPYPTITPLSSTSTPMFDSTPTVIAPYP